MTYDGVPKEAGTIRPCREADYTAILAIVNEAAQAYRRVIPADCWHEPYMSIAELQRDIAAGVMFSGYDSDGTLMGVMGLQRVKDVELIRHAYVRPGLQRGGVGTALIGHLRGMTERRMLVGTWAAATWAISFYQRNGFDLVSARETPKLLRQYWSISERQIETSVVLASPPR
jgi:GNAT superfamily N-acetyltransferase